MRYSFLFITVLTAFVSFSPAMAGGNSGDENLGPISECELREITGQPPCRRLTEEEKKIIREGVRVLNRLIVRQLTESTTVIVVPDHYHGTLPSPRIRRNSGFYSGPMFRNPRFPGVWGDASQYEAETGKICPYGGYKEFIGGRYYCRIR